MPDDLAVIRLDGTVAEGDPGGVSTEVVAMHTEVYRAGPQAGAVIHTHSRTCWRSPWRVGRCRSGTAGRLEPSQRALAVDRGHIVSGILFLGHAKVGSRSALGIPGRWLPAPGRHGLPPERLPATTAGATRPWWGH